MTTFPEQVRDRLETIMALSDQDQADRRSEATILRQVLSEIADLRDDLSDLAQPEAPVTLPPPPPPSALPVADRHRLVRDLGFGDVVVQNGRARRVLKVSTNRYDHEWTHVVFHDSPLWTEEEALLRANEIGRRSVVGTPHHEAFRSDRSLRLIESHEIDTNRLPFVNGRVF